VIVKPLTRPRRRSWAVLSAGWRTLVADGPEGTWRAQGPAQCYELIDRLADRTLYTLTSLTSIIHSTGAGCWTADIWRGRATRLYLDGSKASVCSLRGALSDDPAAACGALATAFEWLAPFGVYPGGIGSMGFNLWRATLPRAVELRSSYHVAEPAVFGGRQQIREARTYSAMKVADLVAAYPSEMAARPFALSLRSVSPTTRLDPTVAGLARAHVVVPVDLPYYPLPLRVGPAMVSWPFGIFEGTWSWAELNFAARLGCTVEIERSWAPSRSANLFGAWWTIVREGRSLGGGAGKLIKAMANSLWGTFAMRGDDTAKVRWTDDIGDRSVKIEQPARRLPHSQTAHIAAEASSRVRIRMLREGLYGTGFSPVHVDTDGIIIRSSAPLPEPTGDQPGEWRTKERMRKVEIRAPQVYRYRCEKGCGVRHSPWHYVTAGVPAANAPAVFDRVSRRFGVSIGLGDRDIVLPPWDANDRPGLDRLGRLAEAISTDTYGPPLGEAS
jgi:hypothetical protein